LMLVQSVPFRSRAVQIVSGENGDNVAEVQYCPITPVGLCQGIVNSLVTMPCCTGPSVPGGAAGVV
jgi:hypothetical protein